MKLKEGWHEVHRQPQKRQQNVRPRENAPGNARGPPSSTQYNPTLVEAKTKYGLRLQNQKASRWPILVPAWVVHSSPDCSCRLERNQSLLEVLLKRTPCRLRI